jgi:hypothetical protein
VSQSNSRGAIVENWLDAATVERMRVTKASVTRSCAICERTLLMGEYAMRYSPNGVEYVDVCPLCQDAAVDYGWVREGMAAPPVHGVPAGRRRRSRLSVLLGTRQEPPAPVVSEPLLRRLGDDELALVEAAELFNGSQYRRTVSGVAKALGAPQVSIIPLSGVNNEMVVTFAWDISWYQYRVAPEAAQAVRLAERGHDLDELSETYSAWNASLGEDGRVVPSVEFL